jgi:hypothetical protein
MTEDRATREMRQETASASKEKKVYQKPAFRFERVFETQALSCGKTAATMQTCSHNRSAS